MSVARERPRLSGVRCPGLAAELLRRAAADQHARGVRDNGEDVPPDPAAMPAVDRENTAFLARVLAEHGWPGFTLVGEEAARAAWVLAQHADAAPEVQDLALYLLGEAVRQGEAKPQHWAYLTDRCLVRHGKPQLFGTQYTHTEHGPAPHPVTDPDRLDARRADVGLEPHTAYDARIRRRHPPAGEEEAGGGAGRQPWPRCKEYTPKEYSPYRGA